MQLQTNEETLNRGHFMFMFEPLDIFSLENKETNYNKSEISS